MKHSKLFLTGMAALLLSFGLMMTGCDSGGDSDDDTGPADTEDTSLIYKSTDSGGTTTYVLILQDDTPAQGDTFALFVAPTATFGSAIPIDGAITGTPTSTQIVLRPANNADGTNDITAAFNADGELTGLTTTGTHAGIAATGLTGQPVDTLAGTFGIDKSEPLVGDTITATLAPTTPAAIDATTLVKYQWYTGTSATAIDTKITSATAAAYTVVTGDQGKYLKVEVRVIGFHGIKAAATNAVTEGSGPQITEKDSAAFAVTAGDTALKITGTTTTASFKDGSGIKVYIKDNGKEALITDATPAPTGYTAPSGTAVLIAEHDATSGKPVLWVKGLTAAATPVASGKLISGTADITVKIAVGAQDGDVGAVAAPVSGVATVIPAGTYAINGTAGSAGQITLVSGYQITYFSSASGASQVQNAPVPAANDFNKQIIDVLTTATSGLVADDKITVDAKGIITGAEIVAASPTTAKINAVLALLDTTLGVDGAPDDDVTVPAGVTLTIAASKKLTIPASKTLTVSGTLAVAGILAWTNNTAVLIIQAGGEVTGTAAAAFHAKAATTTGADLALTVTAASDPTTATGWTSSNATAPASVVLTTTSPAGAPGTGSAYVLGNASFAINNCTTGAAVTAVTSTVGTPAAGGIKAGTGTAVVIIGSA